MREDQPAPFTPPAVDDVNIEANLKLSDYDKYKLAVAKGATPENYAELPSLVPGPSARNPDWDFVREAGVVPYISKPLQKGLQAVGEKIIEPVAAAGINYATPPGLMELALHGKRLVEPGKPILKLPKLTEQELEGATPGERVAAGIGEGVGGVLEGLSTPGNLATLPFAEFKPVQGYFGMQMAAALPEQMQAITEAKDPHEAARAYTALAGNLGLAGLFGHSLLKEGAPGASKIKEAAEVHGNVPAQPGQGEGQVPIQEGGAGVQPPRPVQAQVSLTPEVKSQLKGLGYNDEAINAMTPEAAQSELAKAATLAKRAKGPLSDEHAKALAQHMNEVDHTFGQLREGAVMLADHDNGQVVVDPQQFAKWYDEDLKGLSPKEKAAAVKSAFEHEDIHLKTDPEDAAPFWNSLSKFEQWVLKRQYLKGQDAARYTDAQLGFEAIRNRVERAMGLTRSDFIGMALREKWTAQGLDHLANVVDKIRRLKDSELNAHQKAILDKVQENILAARNAVSAGGTTTDDENQPFMGRRNTEKEGEGTPDMFGAMPPKGFTPDVPFNRDISDFIPTTRDLIKHEQQFLLSPEAESLPAEELQSHKEHLKKLMEQFEKEAEKPYNVQAPEMTRRNEEEPGGREEGKIPPGSTTYQQVVNMSDADATSFFDKIRKQGNAVQNDSVLAGMKLSPADIPMLQQLRDRMHQQGMKKLQDNIASGKPEMPVEMGKVIWLNGALEGAARKGPNYESVVTRRRQNAPEMSRRIDEERERTEDALDHRLPGWRDQYGMDWSHQPKDVQKLFQNLATLEYRKQQAASPDITTFDENTGMWRKPKIYGEGGAPEMARRKDKGSEELMPGFKFMSAKGVPGQEAPEVVHTPVEEVPHEQKIWPQEIDWQEKSKIQGQESLPYRPIAPSEAKSAAELKTFLTEDARTEGTDKPVSFTKRATVLFDKTDGSVHIVSTYPGDGTVRMVDPSLAGSARPNKPIEELLHRYTPIASILFRDERQNFHQKFLTMDEYNQRFGDEAKALQREHFTGLLGVPGAEGQTLKGPTLTGTKESGYTGIKREEGTPEQAVFNRPKGEREPTMDRPNTEELKAISDYFGENPPSDFEWFDKQFRRLAATGTKQMISAIRKMMRLEMQTHRGQSPGEALTKVLQQIYENLSNTETRKGFVTRTLAQIRSRVPEEVPAGGQAPKTGARNLTKLEFLGPRKPATGTGVGTPEGAVPLTPPEKLSPEGVEEVNRQVRMQTVEGSPTAPMSPTIYRQLANRQVPKERYTVTGQKSKLDDVFKLEDVDPDEVDEVIKEMEEEEQKRQNPDLAGFTERELMSEKPVIQLSEQSDPEQLTKAPKEKKGRTKEGKTGMEMALEKAESSKRQAQLDLGQRADAPKEDYVFEQHLEEKQMREMAKRMKDPNTHGDEKVKIREELFRRINEYYHKYGRLPLNPEGPAMLRKVTEAKDKLKDFMERTGRNVATAGDLSDQLYRLKTSEKADYDLALPVIKAALKSIPPEDRPVLMKYADEMQVLKKSNIKLTDAQQATYNTFLKPLLDDNQKMYNHLVKQGAPVGDSTYLTRIVQDTHSLYSRLWRGAKQRITEGSLLGHSASFFKHRVFKALEDGTGKRQLIALVGSGKERRVIAYDKGKATLMGKMPPESLEVQAPKGGLKLWQRVVENRRLAELEKLDREEWALIKEKDRLSKDPNHDPAIMKEIDDRLSSINADYVDVAEKYPSLGLDVPRMWTDASGKSWRFTDALVSEIEGNTNTRYYKEPMSAIITQNLKLKQIYRANQFLENLKNSPDFQRISRPVGEHNVDPDWRTVDLPQFRGLRIEPRTAEVLDLFAKESKGPEQALKHLTRIQNFLRNSLFVWNPFVHEPNLLAHWFTARGIEWGKPAGYDRMVKSGVAALTDVMTRSRFRDQALRAGAPLLRGMGDINKQLLASLRHELNPNPSTAQKLAKGLGYINPLRMVRAFGDSLTWGTNEVLTLQLIRETMARTGLPLEDAINEVGKHMPNYRIPPRVLLPGKAGLMVGHVMRNPLLTLWGHYHYGALRSYGEMAKEIFSPNSTMTQRAEGLGRVATIGFLMAVAYPVIDDIVNKVLKTKGLKMRRAGSATFPQAVMELAQHKRTPEAVLQSVATPATVLQGAGELAFNRDFRSGLPVYERRLGTQTLKDLGRFAASKISPLEEGSRVAGGKKSAEEFGLGLAGISRTRADSAMSRFNRMADDWMRNNPSEAIRDQYKRRTQDVFAESDYQTLRSAIIREDGRAAQMAVDKLLRTREPEDVMSRIQQWEDAPFTGTRDTDTKLIQHMTLKDLDLWRQAAHERLDIAEGMRNAVLDKLVKESKAQ